MWGFGFWVIGVCVCSFAMDVGFGVWGVVVWGFGFGVSGFLDLFSVCLVFQTSNILVLSNHGSTW